jgi:beta-1,4-mannosyl-glycoprotein beta-1,4-N-acetylglucosaminyltransferase
VIYDCFIFFNELDLLEIRLNILDSVVDKFVLVEATHTFQGKPKPLHYSENQSRFEKFKDKIIHVVVDDLAPWSPFSRFKKYSGAWEMETHQRNAIARGLTHCKPDDTVIISDLDEIPDPGKIREYHAVPGIKIFQQKLFYHYINCVSLSEEWYGSVMGPYRYLGSPQGFRSISREMHGRGSRIIKDPLYRFFRSISNPRLFNKITVLYDAGWHFGYLGGAENVIAKIEAFSHTEYNKEEFKDKDTILQRISSGKDLFGRDLQYAFVPIDNTFPKYIVENKERFRHLIRETN